MLAVLAATLVACGGGGGAEQWDAAVAVVAPPPKKPAIDPAIVAQCKTILATSWTAIGPALAKLEVDKTAELEKAYKATQPFIDRCVKLAKDARDCLQGSTNPVAGIRTCKVNERAKGNDRLYAPSLRAFIRLLAPTPISKSDSARLLMSLAGSWKNTWADEKTERVWTFTEGSDLETTTTVEGGEPKKAAYTIELDMERRLKARSAGSVRRFLLVKADRRTLFASPSLLYDVFPMPDAKAFAVRNGGDYILFENGSCEVVTSEGLVAEATCKHGRERHTKVFTASYELPGGAKHEVEYILVGSYLVPNELYDCCLFKQ